jgi:hypothetical protein
MLKALKLPMLSFKIPLMLHLLQHLQSLIQPQHTFHQPLSIIKSPHLLTPHLFLLLQPHLFLIQLPSPIQLLIILPHLFQQHFFLLIMPSHLFLMHLFLLLLPPPLFVMRLFLMLLPPSLFLLHLFLLLQQPHLFLLPHLSSLPNLLWIRYKQENSLALLKITAFH